MNKRLILCLWLACAVRLCGEPVLEADLGPRGEIPCWLMLGDIPIPGAVDKEQWPVIAQRDLLAPVGGATGVEPVGGATVTLPEGSFTWKIVSAEEPPGQRKRQSRPGWGGILRPPLFFGPDGNDVEYASVYLFCRLIAEESRKVDLLFGSDDSARILLNGKLVYDFVGQRSAGTDAEVIELALNRGPNDLLVRVDNYIWSGGFVARLLTENAVPPDGIRVQLPAGTSTPHVPPGPDRDAESWANLISEIPPLAPLPHEERLGARLTRTLSLLESGAYTGRPVRIVFFGQSITAQQWTDMLVERLRERYPRTTIEMENHSIGGWNVWRLMRAMHNGTLQSRPDLFVFFAYNGSSDDWERVLSAVRRETCADILIRSAHWAARDWDTVKEKDDSHYPGPNREATMLRALAQKYDCELVEVRRYWWAYAIQHHLEDYPEDVRQGRKNMVRDGIHLNRPGNILMAQLHERHFRSNFNARSLWANRVRWHEALRVFDEKLDGALAFHGDGWQPSKTGWDSAVTSSSSDDSLRLRFTGTRADVVLAPGSGGARVMIDGRAPSELNLYYATLPKQKIGSKGAANIPSAMRVFTGPDMREETWVLRWTHASPNGRHYRFTLTGSRTGFDGAGSDQDDFISNSGRIRIYRNDLAVVVPIRKMQPGDPDELQAFREPIEFTFQILPRFKEEIRWEASATPAAGQPDWSYITVVDGLPYGEHELTLTPLGDGPVAIRGIDVYRPPLADNE